MKHAFRKAALRWHPDKLQSKGDLSEKEMADADARFKALSMAYTVLSDPRMRRQYDAGARMADLLGGSGMSGFA